MKYKFLVLLMILIIFTGCSKSKLTCEKNTKNPGYIYNESYKLIYDESGEDLKQIDLKMESTYNEHYTAEEIDEEYEEVVEYCEFYEAASNKLIECKAKLKKSIITVNIKIKVEKINDELFENMMYVTKEEINKRKEAKKMLENVGYTCK